jgi:hypothetical protein
MSKLTIKFWMPKMWQNERLQEQPKNNNNNIEVLQNDYKHWI